MKVAVNLRLPNGSEKTLMSEQGGSRSKEEA